MDAESQHLAQALADRDRVLAAAQARLSEIQRITGDARARQATSRASEALAFPLEPLARPGREERERIQQPVVTSMPAPSALQARLESARRAAERDPGDVSTAGQIPAPDETVDGAAGAGHDANGSGEVLSLHEALLQRIREVQPRR
jgi:hypothetical protein